MWVNVNDNCSKEGPTVSALACVIITNSHLYVALRYMSPLGTERGASVALFHSRIIEVLETRIRGL